MTKRHYPPAMVLGAVVLTAIVLVAVFAPLVWGDDAATLGSAIRQDPSSEHLLGTDSLGRDILQRTLVATRLTVVMALAATAIAAVLGTLIGAGTLVAGRFVQSAGARVIDLLVAYPPIIVAMAITAIFSPGTTTVVVAIGIAFCPQFARLTNTLARSVAQRDYVVTARLIGVGRRRILMHHIVPNILTPVLVLVSVGFATSIVSLSGLSFIGLGVQQPSYDWGGLLAAGQRNLSTNALEALGPATAILITGLAAGLFGDGLARYLDPRSQLVRAPRPRGLVPARPGDSVTESSAPVRLRNLEVATSAGLPLVRGVSLTIGEGEIVGLVGESGSGKSVTAMAVSRLLPPELDWRADELHVTGLDVADPSASPPTALATRLGVVFQDPSTSFNPAIRMGPQLSEVLRVHGGESKRAAYAEAAARLREVRVSSPESRLHQYPFELSGGMRQRAMIAMALLARPALLVADEPTTALDVTVQADVLRLLHQINRDHGTAILLISHDIHAVAALCHRVCVMYAGRIVEELTVERLRAGEVSHPYTKALLAASPTDDADRDTNPLQPLPGRPPRPNEVGKACSFADRCTEVMPRCRTSEPTLLQIGDGAVACYAHESEKEGVS